MKNAVNVSPIDMDARKNLDLRAGDSVRVWQKIEEEKGKIRLQAFEGLVLARKHGTEAGGTFTVRRVLSGVGVEKIFPIYSPMIDKIEIIKRSRVRRAKLYYIRDKVAREARRQLRKVRMVGGTTAKEELAEVAAESDVREKSEPVAEKSEQVEKAIVGKKPE
jgi:large subunit ribosomal protein L19